MVRNVRGLGLYQGISLDSTSRKARLIDVALSEHSTILLGAGSRTIRTRPNLSVTEEEIARFITILDLSLAQVQSE
jgi:L-lysine 6-transaminase